MAAINNEDFIPIKDVPDCIPIRRKGSDGRKKKIHISTVWRWASRGVKGRKLQTWRIGGTTCTTMSAIDEFIQGDEPKPSRRDPDRLDRDGW